MRERDVPQKGNATRAGHCKGVYAIADDGRLRLVSSRGWEVEEIVTRQAVEDLERRAMQARARAPPGESSPPENHTVPAAIGVGLLSPNTGAGARRARRPRQPAGVVRPA